MTAKTPPKPPELGPLPIPALVKSGPGGESRHDYFTADDMLSYALQERAAERERCADLERRLALAMRQWDHWKAYALELHDKLQRYEPGPSVMLLNTSAPADPRP